MVDSIKASVKIFWAAFKTLEEKYVSGINELRKINTPKNVMKLTDINMIDERGTHSLNAAQGFPALVMLSLAIEQLIKLLILQELGQDERGHNIKLLFGKLPQAFKVDVLKEIDEKLQIDEETFYKQLDENKNVFVEMRYFYEPTGPKIAGIAFLKSFFDILNSKVV